MPSGGKRTQRTKTQPKPVSGPGRLSQRTDMIPSGGSYGERKETAELLAQGNRATPRQSAVPSPTVAAATPQQKVTDLFAPSEMLDEPVTAGNPLGAGFGPEMLNLPKRSFSPVTILSRLAQSDPTGEIELILSDLRSRGIQ
jgi:hypothetical protein